MAPLASPSRGISERGRIAAGKLSAPPLRPGIVAGNLDELPAGQRQWIVFAAFLLLLTPGKAPVSLASARVASTVSAVLRLAVASVVVPDLVAVNFYRRGDLLCAVDTGLATRESCMSCSASSSRVLAERMAEMHAALAAAREPEPLAHAPDEVPRRDVILVDDDEHLAGTVSFVSRSLGHGTYVEMRAIDAR